MQFPLSALFISGLMVPLALAGHNCKCQDSSGQYNDLTEQVCKAMQAQEVGQASADGILGPILSGIINIFVADAIYHGDQHHQCSSALNRLDSGEFVKACAALGVGTTPYGGAFCWD